MGGALFALAAFGFLKSWPQALSFTLVAVGVLHIVLALFAPKLLTRINNIWMGFGFLLGKVVAPVVMSVLYFVLFTPIAIAMRLFGRDELLIKDKTGESFWKVRANSKITPDSFNYQY